MSTNHSIKTVFVKIANDGWNIEEIKRDSDAAVTLSRSPEKPEAGHSTRSQMNLSEHEFSDISQCSSDDVVKSELSSISKENPECSTSFSTPHGLQKKTERSYSRHSSSEKNKCNGDKTWIGHPEVKDENMALLNDTASEESHRKKAGVKLLKAGSRTQLRKSIDTDKTKISENVLLPDDVTSVTKLTKKACARIEVISQSSRIPRIASFFEDMPAKMKDSELFHHKQGKKLSENNRSVKEAVQNVKTVVQIQAEANDKMCFQLNSSDERPSETADQICTFTDNSDESSSETIGQICSALNNPDENQTEAVDKMCLAVNNSNEISSESLITNSSASSLNSNQTIFSLPSLSFSPLISLDRNETMSYIKKNKTSVSEENTSTKKALKSGPVLKKQSRSFLSEKSRDDLRNKIEAVLPKKSEAVMRKPRYFLKRPDMLQNAQCNKKYKLSLEAVAEGFGESSDSRTETVCNFDTLGKVQSDFSCHTTDSPVSATTVTPPLFQQRIISRGKKKKSWPNRSSSVIIPPPGHVSFNQNGDVKFSSIILNAIPKLVERGSTRIFFLLNKNTNNLTSRRGKMMLKLDLSTVPFKVMPATTSASEVLAKRISLQTSSTESSGNEMAKECRQKVTLLDDLCDMEVDTAVPCENDDTILGADRVTLKAPHWQWTCDDVSKWLTLHGQKKFIKDFTNVDGSSLQELVVCFMEDFKIIHKYLQNLGYNLFDMLKLFAILRALSKEKSALCSSSSHGSSGREHTIFESEEQRGAAFASNHSILVSENSEILKKPEVDSDNVNSNNVSQWTSEDVCSWLTSHGLTRCIKHFSNIDGPSLIELVLFLKADLKTVHTSLYDMKFSMPDSMKLCALLKTLSRVKYL